MTAALTADDVGRILQYGGKEPGVVIRGLYRAGRFPAPIDPSLSPYRWRWSPRVVADYRDGRVAVDDCNPHGMPRPRLVGGITTGNPHGATINHGRAS